MRLGFNWQGLLLAICTWHSPAHIIGTTGFQQQDQGINLLRLMDGYWSPDSLFLTRELVQSIYCSIFTGWWVHLLCIYSSSFVLNILGSDAKSCHICVCKEIIQCVYTKQQLPYSATLVLLIFYISWANIENVVNQAKKNVKEVS